MKGLKKEHMKDKAIWIPLIKAHDESLKKAKDELNEARITQEKLLVKVHSILIEQGRISEIQSSTTDEQEREGQEFKASSYNPGPIDKTTSDLIFQLIS